MRLRSLTLSLLVGLACAAEPAAPLVGNGSFETVKADGSIDGWSLPAGGSWGQDPANHFLHLTTGEPGKMVMLYREVSVVGMEAVRVRCRIRTTGVVKGDQPWFDARMILDFKNAAKEKVSPGPRHPNFPGTTDGWKQIEVTAKVPAGAVTLEIMPTLFNTKAGSLDVDDLSVEAISLSKVATVEKPIISPTAIEIDAKGPALSRLHIDGKQVVDEAGKPVWLQGVNVPSLEYSNQGDAIIPAVVTAIEIWKANVIRLPVAGNRWFGQEPTQNDNGVAYRALVQQAITAATSRGARVILDLHRFRAPTEADAAFWKDAATTFKDQPGVLFGLFNEPHGITWEIWQKGGEVSDKPKNSTALTENKEALTKFTSVGMQGLIDAVRETGAKNMVVVGGLDWAYDLSGVINGYPLDDKGGEGILWDTHVYTWKSGWQKAFLDAADKLPVIVGEVGCDVNRYDFIPPDRFEAPWQWAPDMIGLIQARKLHWTAWSFHPKGGPAMLVDHDEWMPSPFWGAFVRSALAGGSFTNTHLR
jgi:hypothetical protein